MAFKLTPEATFPATVLVPNGDAPLPLKVVYRRKSRTALKDFTLAMSSKDDLTLCMEILAGWDDVEKPFDQAALAELLEAYSGAGLAIVSRYFEAHARAERKN